MRQAKQKICIILIMALSLSFVPLFLTNAGQTSDLINQKQKEIADVQNQKKNLQTGLTDVKKILKDLENTKSNLKNYVTKLDVSLNTIEEKLAELNTLIEEQMQKIRITKEKLAEAEKIEEEQYQAMKIRIKFMYEKGDNFYLELVLSAESFGEFLNKADYVTMLSDYDRKMLNEFKAIREAIAALKVELEEEEEQLKEAKKVQEDEQAAMETLISAKETEINYYESDISNKEQLVSEYEAEIAAQNAVIAALEKAVADEKKRLAAINGATQKYDGGKFAFPAPSYKRISDEYGYRTHPILKVQQFHNGVDLAAPSGSPILSAYEGTVVQASYSNTMGNYIMIDHGDGLYTIYMHASALHVSSGEKVTRGQKIASVGSTGRSTGPHLHFSVRLNGSYVSPWNYIS